MCDADRSVQQVNKERSSVVVERSSFQSPTPLLFYLSPPPHSSRFFKVPVTDDVTTLKISNSCKTDKKKHNEVVVWALRWAQASGREC